MGVDKLPIGALELLLPLLLVVGIVVLFSDELEGEFVVEIVEDVSIGSSDITYSIVESFFSEPKIFLIIDKFTFVRYHVQ